MADQPYLLDDLKPLRIDQHKAVRQGDRLDRRLIDHLVRVRRFAGDEYSIDPGWTSSDPLDADRHIANDRSIPRRRKAKYSHLKSSL